VRCGLIYPPVLCGQADEAANQKSVSLAELRLGQALAAEPEHADRDAYGAAKVRHFFDYYSAYHFDVRFSWEAVDRPHASLVSAWNAL